MTEPQRQQRKRPRGPRTLSLARIENIARFHIERFATTSTHLRRVLARRAERARRIHGGDSTQVSAWINEVVDRLVRLGLINDEQYAKDKVASLRRLGRGPGRIGALLAAKGVPRTTIARALAEAAEGAAGEDASLPAALAYVKRRRFGVFGKTAGDKLERARKYTRELAAMGRAGFSYAVARRALSDKPDRD